MLTGTADPLKLPILMWFYAVRDMLSSSTTCMHPSIHAYIYLTIWHIGALQTGRSASRHWHSHDLVAQILVLVFIAHTHTHTQHDDDVCCRVYSGTTAPVWASVCLCISFTLRLNFSAIPFRSLQFTSVRFRLASFQSEPKVSHSLTRTDTHTHTRNE